MIKLIQINRCSPRFIEDVKLVDEMDQGCPDLHLADQLVYLPEGHQQCSLEGQHYKQSSHQENQPLYLLVSGEDVAHISENAEMPCKEFAS